MFDTMTLTKIVGGFCGALLVFLLGNFFAGMIYGPGEGGGEKAQAYTIQVADSGSSSSDAQPAADTGPDWATVYASADPAAGAKVVKKCKACHKLQDGVNATGPSLYGVVGRKVDSEPGFSYSGALEKVFDVWTPENIEKFITKPKDVAPGTKMGFAGLSKIQDRANVIAYLATNPG